MKSVGEIRKILKSNLKTRSQREFDSKKNTSLILNKSSLIQKLNKSVKASDENSSDVIFLRHK